MALGTPSLTAQKYGGLSHEQLIWIYRTMYLSRKLDEKEIQLHRQGRTFFEISAAGHESLQMAAALSLRAGSDWISLYYRGRTLALALGITPREQLLEALGAATAPFSGGRQMPSHWGSRKLHILSRSSATGMQWAQAVGLAEAALFYQHSTDAAREAVSAGDAFEPDEIVCVTGGDGATSEGEFYESLNAACLRRAPVLFLIEDNGYAISVPVDVQTCGGSISRLVAGYPHLHVEVVDGTDFWKSREAMQRAVAHCRERRGPALVHGHVMRLHSHSLSDDQRLYKTEEEIAAEAARDPLVKYANWLEAEAILLSEARARLERDVEQEVEQAAAEALGAPAPQPDTIRQHVYSPRVNPCSAEFDRSPRFVGDPRTMVELLNACLRDEMKRNPRIVLFGQDIADCSHEEKLGKVKGKGGVFKVTHGLQKQFGSQRVFNAP
ncbi:MAG TPA: thiamine pyrophosphate-dependent enzyme, partial [Terriglobia bacterium]|nr:thiamine pyrophosphate-dependent enzyme [Terriglobia bacterium]